MIVRTARCRALAPGYLANDAAGYALRFQLCSASAVAELVALTVERPRLFSICHVQCCPWNVLSCLTISGRRSRKPLRKNTFYAFAAVCVPRQVTRAAKPNHVARQFVVGMVHFGVFAPARLTWQLGQRSALQSDGRLRPCAISSPAFALQRMSATPVTHVSRMTISTVSPGSVMLVVTSRADFHFAPRLRTEGPSTRRSGHSPNKAGIYRAYFPAAPLHRGEWRVWSASGLRDLPEVRHYRIGSSDRSCPNAEPAGLLSAAAKRKPGADFSISGRA